MKNNLKNKFRITYFRKIIAHLLRRYTLFFLLSCMSAFILFIVILAPLTLSNYEKNSLSNYNYNSSVNYKSTPMNAVSFAYNKKLNSSDLSGYPGQYSNYMPTYDPENKNPNSPDNIDAHDFEITQLRALSKEKNQAEREKKATAIMGGLITLLPWLGGVATTSEWVSLVSSQMSLKKPQCFDPTSKVGPSCIFSGLQASALAGVITGQSGIKMAYYHEGPLTSSSSKNYNYYPIDVTSIPTNTSKFVKTNDSGLIYVCNDLSLFSNNEVKGKNALPIINGPASFIIRAIVDYAPHFVSSGFMKKNSNFNVTYNLSPYNAKNNLKFTYIDSATNDNSTWMGIDTTNENSKFSLENDQNKNLVPLLQKNNSPPSASDPYRVVINKNYQFSHGLKLDDKFTYQMKIPTLFYSADHIIDQTHKGAPITDFSPYNFTSGLFSSLSYKNVDMNDLTKNNTKNGPNVSLGFITEKVICQVAGISRDSAKPRIFTNQQVTNKLIWDTIGIQSNQGIKYADYGYKNYFNGKFSTYNTPLDIDGFGLMQVYGSYNAIGLQGKKDKDNNYQKFGEGKINFAYSTTAAKKQFANLRNIIIALLVIIGFFLLAFAIIFLATSINIFLNDNRKTILMYKTFGYKVNEIAKKFIIPFIVVVIIAFFAGIPASYFAFIAIINWISTSNGFYLPIYLAWWEPIVSLIGSAIILFIIYFITRSYINKINLASEWRDVK